MRGNGISTAARAIFLGAFALVTVCGILRGNGSRVILRNDAPLLKGAVTVANYGHGERPVAVAPQVSARGAALISANTGELIFGKSSDLPLPMASTTKIMTALIALEHFRDLDTQVVVPREAVGVEGSSIYLYEGEKITVRDLLYGLLLESGNDAAVALAVAVSGSEEAFADRMTERARELGLTRTVFKNPHGLSADGHVTTAYELARIACEAMRNENFRGIVSQKVYSAEGTSENAPARYFSNHNKLLRTLPGAIGVKTGYTIASGRCLVSCTERGDTSFIAVTLDDRNDWADHTAMHEYAFAHYEAVVLAEKGALIFSPETTPICNGEEVVGVRVRNS